MDDSVKPLLSSVFVSSWIGRAREGDRYDVDRGRRSAAWAQWAVRSLRQLTGNSDRRYPALLLDGRFHDPRSQGPLLKPHIEIPGRVLESTDPEFVDRLASFGNALAFPWWLVPEVMAVKRVVFPNNEGTLMDVTNLLDQRRPALVVALTDLQLSLISRWSEVEDLLVREPDSLLEAASGDFSAGDVAAFFPAGSELSLSVTYDQKLREVSGHRVSRRVGVWQLHGKGERGEFCVGVGTPRLTASSQFNDPLFSPDREAPAALLVRGLLLRRISRHIAGVADVSVGNQALLIKEQGAYLKAVVAQVGQKLPEAGIEAAVSFVRTYPDSEMAWMVLSDWASKSSTVLTVRGEGFKDAHRRVLRMVRRADDPDRDDVNVLLPLGWDEQSRVVRVTFGKRQPKPTI